eukprot:gnl/TRDRNA2_/TRDRNA2_144591_c0_seq2.p1 gnl/TRDRNA2_/TRDRNA2_144591_c0~~gnl/TRDRNA2_/TRDRNA2_144591_c0_seq2.p1  ORF type:complete len:605 (-),score=41.86 gnl/TRDRNA2_/TRDRNA2_144591_c0_seq2:118-1887(-)
MSRQLSNALACVLQLACVGGVAQHVARATDVQSLHRLMWNPEQPGYCLVFFHFEKTWQDYPSQKEVFRDTVRLLSKPTQALGNLSILPVVVTLDAPGIQLGKRYLNRLLKFYRPGPYTELLLVDRQKSYFTAAETYRGIMTAEAIAEFAWIRVLNANNITHVHSTLALKDVVQIVPSFVACLDAPRGEMFEEFLAIATSRGAEMAAVVITKLDVCPFGTMPSVGFIKAGGVVGQVLKEGELKKQSCSEWLGSIGLLSSTVLPEMTPDNILDFTGRGGWLVVFMFDHSKTTIKQAAEQLAEPLITMYSDAGSRLQIVSASSIRYGRTYGVLPDVHVVMFLNLESRKDPLNTIVESFTSPEAWARIRNHCAKVAQVSKIDISDKVIVEEGILNARDAELLRSIFSDETALAEESPLVLDSVDDMPTFELHLESQGNCTSDLCSMSREIVKNKIQTKVNSLARYWHSKARVKRIVNMGTEDAERIQDLQVCESFIRRYMPMERRSHPVHKDDQSQITVNVKLSDKDSCVGGLVVYPDAKSKTRLGHKMYPEKGLGSAVIHTSDLWHGVDVSSGWRYSWIIWFAETCGHRAYT